MNALAVDFSAPVLPQDAEIEQAVLGGCILYPNQIAAVEAACSPGDFFHDPHAAIMQAIIDLSNAGKPVSPLSIQGILGSNTQLKEVGGHGYLAGLAQAAPSGGIAHLARVVSDLRQRRDGLHALMLSQEAIVNRATPITEALQPAQEVADDAAERASRAADVSTQDASEAFCMRLQDVVDGKPIPAVSSGLTTLDHILKGLQAGDFTLYAGRPGSGKSVKLAKTMFSAAREGRPSLFFELEMTKDQLLARLGCAIDYESHPDDPMSYEWFRGNDVRPYQLERMAVALRQIPNDLHIFDRAGMTIHEIAALARGFAKRSKKMGIVGIDYIQLVKPGDRYKGNPVQEMTEISKAAKHLAKGIGWPVVAACQLNRNVEQREDKKPILSDLRESGQLEQDADQVIGLYRQAYYMEAKRPLETDTKYGEWEDEYNSVKHRLDLGVLKNRHGRTKSIDVFCDMRASVILDEKPVGAR